MRRWTLTLALLGLGACAGEERGIEAETAKPEASGGEVVRGEVTGGDVVVVVPGGEEATQAAQEAAPAEAAEPLAEETGEEMSEEEQRAIDEALGLEEKAPETPEQEETAKPGPEGLNQRIAPPIEPGEDPGLAWPDDPSLW